MKENEVINIISNSSDETAKIGNALGRVLSNGDLVLMNGGLGTGKTAFTGGLAKALGVDQYITSPTFTIVNEYTGKIPLYHFDVYRISDSEEMYEIGFEEYFENNGIIVIEWAEIIKDVLPKEFIEVTIQKDLQKGLDVRNISLKFIGYKYKNHLERFACLKNNF